MKRQQTANIHIPISIPLICAIMQFALHNISVMPLKRHHIKKRAQEISKSNTGDIK